MNKIAVRVNFDVVLTSLMLALSAHQNTSEVVSNFDFLSLSSSFSSLSHFLSHDYQMKAKDGKRLKLPNDASSKDGVQNCCCHKKRKRSLGIHFCEIKKETQNIWDQLNEKFPNDLRLYLFKPVFDIAATTNVTPFYASFYEH